jgi:hypothetical protein
VSILFEPSKDFSKSIETTLLCTTPIMTSRLPSRRASTAPTPSLLAKTLSKQLGEPPLWIWPKTVTLHSYSSRFSCM